MNFIHRLLALVCPFCLLSGCNLHTLGIDFMGKSHLRDSTYIDLNTIPEKDEAQKPNGLHEGDENLARQKDLGNLEKKRLKLQKVGEQSRRKAFPSSPHNEKKEAPNGDRSGS